MKEEVAGQVEMPFVPADQRQEKRTIIEDTVKDSIVVVGQGSRQRKRKRGLAKTNKEAKTEGVAEETFDYAAVSNILDEGSDHEPETVGGGRKRRNRTQGTWHTARVFGTADCLHRQVRLWELPGPSKGAQRRQVW